MAKKRDNDFDAESFIEDVRADSVATYQRAADIPKEKPPDCQPSPQRESNKSENRKSSFENPDDVFDDDEYDIAQKYSSLNMTEDEIEFIKAFIAKNKFRQVTQKGKQIVIREAHRKRIKSILDLLDEDANMATYIDNVLTEHFRQFYPTILSIYRKCPPKF